MLYHIDNLREAVEMAKRVLAKEQMDKKAGQSSTILFMQLRVVPKTEIKQKRKYPLVL